MSDSAKWAMRAAVVAAVSSLVIRTLRSRAGSRGTGAPTIGGDTWPPVPTNPGPSG